MQRILCILVLVLILSLVCGFSSPSFSKGVRAFNSGNYRTAIELFQRTVKKAPAEAIVHYNLGMAYFKNDNYIAAKASFMTAIQLDPRFEPLSRFYMGLCYYQEGDLEKARGEMQWVAQTCGDTGLSDAAKEVMKTL